MPGQMDIAILGLSLRSAWGNGHATTWRALVRALLQRGHRVRFYERNCSWYADNQDLPADLAPYLTLYDEVESLREAHGMDIVGADAVILGSFVPEGARVGEWLLREAHGITAFYDIDTPVTMAKLDADDCDYLHPDQIPRFVLYLSFTGGPFLEHLRARYGANAEPLYCSVDAALYAPSDVEATFDLGYLGTYSADRQRLLRSYLIDAAAAWPEGRFAVAGPQYPGSIRWPDNVERTEHLPPERHRTFYTSQRFTLNLTRAEMTAAGWSPSVRLFEAAACGVPVISDVWKGIEAFFAPGREILLADDPGQVLEWLRSMPETARRAIGSAARRRVLGEHTAEHRAATLEQYLDRATPRHAFIRSNRSICHDTHDAKTTTNPETIRQWVEERGGKPATVHGTGRGEPGVLRIAFGDDEQLDDRRGSGLAGR